MPALCHPQRFALAVILSAVLVFSGNSLSQDASPQATPAPQPSPASSPQPPAHAKAPTGPPAVQEQLIAEMPAGSEYVAADILGSHLVWVEKSGDKKTVRLDGKQLGGSYQDVRYLGFRGKAEDPHVLMVAKRQDKWMALYDGQERTPEYDKMSAADVGPDGRPLIAGGCRGKKCSLVVDGKETGPEFEEIVAPDFNLKSGHYVYFGKRNKKWVAMLDGKESGPEMDDFSRFRWGPEGKRLAVAALLGKKFTWVVDGKPGPLFDVIGLIAFSPDGQHFAFGGANVKSGFGDQEVHGSIVADGQQSENSWKGEGLTGRWTAIFGSFRYVLKGVKSLSADFHGVSDPEYLWDGSLIFAQRLGNGNVVVRFSGRAGPSVDDVVSPIIVTEDGKHLAYVGRQGDSFIEVRDQVAGPSFPGKREVAFVGWIMMSKDGAHLAYEIVRGGTEFKQGKTRRAQRRVVLDGKGGPEYDAHNLVPSPFHEEGSPEGGSHYLYTVHGAQGDRDRVVLDGVEGPLYDDVFSPSVRFVDGQTVEFIARQGRRFLRVTMKIG